MLAALDRARDRLPVRPRAAEHRRLAGAVDPDEADAVAGPDAPVDVVAGRVRRPTSSRTSVQVEHVLAQPAGRKVLQHKRVARRRLVGDQRVGRLDAELRLRRARGRAAAQPRQLLAHQVLPPRLGRRGQPVALGAWPARRRRTRRRRGRRRRRAPPTSGADRVEEPAVVASPPAAPAARRSRQMLGQPGDALDVEVVRRLVEHDDVVAGHQHRGQRHPASLAAGEPARPRVSRSTPDSRSVDDVAGRGVGGPLVVGPTADDDVAPTVRLPRGRRSGRGSPPTARDVCVTRPESGPSAREQPAAAWTCRRRCARRRRSRRPRRRRG